MKKVPEAAPEALWREQIRYYRERAPEYDQWILRQGRFDRGAEHRRDWQAGLQELANALREADPGGKVLEIACGTGQFTPVLAAAAEHLTALDAAPEAIEICRAKAPGNHVDYIVADFFPWHSPQTYDFIFFAFWLSHVPPERFESFWALVREALAPGGRVFFVDSLFAPDSTATNHAPIDRSGVVERKLNDGRAFRIYKTFHRPSELEERLTALGWRCQVRQAGPFFLHGLARQGQMGAGSSPESDYR